MLDIGVANQVMVGYLRSMAAFQEYKLSCLVVLAMLVCALVWRTHTTPAGAGVRHVQLTGAGALPNPSPTPTWTDRKYEPSGTRDEFHLGVPLLTNKFKHYQGYILFPRAFCTLDVVRCVYVRYWPRDPPIA